MKTLHVKSRSGDYPVYIGRGVLAEAASHIAKAGLGRKVMIVSQSGVAKYYLKPLLGAFRHAGLEALLCLVPDSETAKSPAVLNQIYEKLIRNTFERRDWIAALGGGVAGDLAGFAAATYLRGVPFINIPTTLLAQVDSSIGGKTGINLKQGKNLVGAFYPPKAVIADTLTLKTLPRREIRAALGEIIKYGMIRDPQILRQLEKNAPGAMAGKPEVLEPLITASASIKVQIVSRDEFETKGERMILNFGHTFGHGFEQALGYRGIKHGESVALGMICANRLARRLNLFSSTDEARFEALIKKLDLPLSIAPYRIKTDKILSAMRRDKKNKSGHIRFVLPVKLGRVKIVAQVSEQSVRQVLRELGAL